MLRLAYRQIDFVTLVVEGDAKTKDGIVRRDLFCMYKFLSVVLMIVLTNDANGEMPHHRRCDIAQESPGNLNPEGGNAIMFGLCGGVDDIPTGAAPSRHHFWNAYNCGYQAYRQGKVFGANPYYNDELETRWSAGWKDAQKACRTGKGPFDK
jgi:ribosome modulation factor